MTKNNIIPIALNEIQLTAYSHTDAIFPINDQTTIFAITLAFVNERLLSLKSDSGVRRRVNITIVDVAAEQKVAETSVLVNIGKGETLKFVHADVPVTAYEFTDRHPYRVEVRDLRTRSLLGEETALIERFEHQSGICYSEQEENTLNETDVFEELLDQFISDQSEPENENDVNCTSEPDNTELDNNNDRPTDNQDEDENYFMTAINRLTGLSAVKEKLCAYEKLVRFNKLRANAGLSTFAAPLHAMFLGSPGTGKTTVAKRMGAMLRRAGVLSRGHVVVRERATLLGPNYSTEETKTLEAIEEAQGGILLIDEAYQLYQPNDPRDPGRFVIETLMTELADESKRDWMLILAGYTDDMKQMFKMNPGLRSRIPDSNIYVFNDFSESELMEIAVNYLTNNQYSLTADAHTALHERIAADYACRDKTFGNARHVINLVQTEILPAMAARVVSAKKPTEAGLCEIQAVDIPKPLTVHVSTRPRLGYCA